MESVGKLQGISEGSSCFETRLLSSIQTETTSGPVSDNKKQFSDPVKQKALLESVQQMVQKRAVVPVQNKNSLGFYSRLFLVPKPENKWRPVIDLSVVNTFLHVPTFKMETAEVIRASLQAGEWVASIDLTDAYFHVPIHQKFQKYLLGSGLSIQSPALRDSDCSFGVHSSGERGQIHSSFTGGSNPSVFGRLAGEIQGSRVVCSGRSKIVKSNRKVGLDCQFEEIRTQTNSGSRVSGLSVQPSRRFSVPQSKEVRQAQNSGSFHYPRSLYYPKEAHVTNWGHGFHGENGSFGSDPYETVSVVSEDQLALSPVVGQGGPNFSVDKGPSGLVDGSSELTQGFESASERTQYSDLRRCIREGLGGSLEQLYCKWGLPAIRKRLAYQYFGTESCFSSPETFSRTIKAKNSVGFFRQLNCGLIYQQGRRHSLLRNVCFDVENSGMVQCQGDPYKSQTYSRESQCNSRFPVQEGQGHPDRVVSSSSGLSRNLPSLAQANGGSVCHQLECQTSNLRICCPRRQGLADRCIEHLLGGSGHLCFLSSGHPSPVSSENDHLQVQGHCDSTRVAGDALVLGSGGIVSQDSTEASSSAQSTEATFQSQIPQESGVSESPCVVSGLIQEGQGGFSVEVADRIKAPQRESSRRVYDSRWAIFQKWAQENQVDVTKPTIPQIADFLIIFSLIRT